MKKVAAVIVLSTIAGCREQLPVTSPSVVLFEWELTNASRTAVQTAKIGPRTMLDKKVVVNDSGTFTVDLHVELAEIDFVEGGKPVHQIAPVLLRAKVRENDRWSLAGKCLDGPHYKMPAVGKDGTVVTPPGMVQECSIGYRRKEGTVFPSSWDLSLLLQIYGDGVIKLTPPDHAKIE